MLSLHLNVPTITRLVYPQPGFGVVVRRAKSIKHTTHDLPNIIATPGDRSEFGWTKAVHVVDKQGTCLAQTHDAVDEQVRECKGMHFVNRVSQRDEIKKRILREKPIKIGMLLEGSV